MGRKISAERDVYSYGIFLLEMLSGKRPTGSSILMEIVVIFMTMKNALPHIMMDIDDPRILPYREDQGFSANQTYNTDAIKVCRLCLASIYI